MTTRFIAPFMLLLAAAPIATAQRAAPPADASELVTVGISAMEGVAEPGETFHLAVRFDIAPKWHIYWKNAGATGAPTQVTVNAPDGFEVGETLFPAPHRFSDEVLGDSYGYEFQTVLFVPVTVSQHVSAESASFEIFVDYLVCKEECLIGSAELNLVVPVDGMSDGAKPDEVLARHWNRLPTAFARHAAASLALNNGKLIVTMPLGDVDPSTVDFFPEETPGVRYLPHDGALIDGSAASFAIPLEIKPGNARGKPLRVAGVVTMGRGASARAYAFDRAILGEDHDSLGPDRFSNHEE